MKKLSKTLLAVAAVSAVSMAMAASAMAMTAEYDPESGNVTLSDVNATGASQTLLVVNGEGTSVTTDNANDVVEQIDQKDDSTVFATVPVGQLTDGTYEVRIGGTDGTIQTATFKVGEQSGGETKTIMIGDVDFSDSINAMDATFIARYCGDATENIGNVNESYATSAGDSNVLIGDADMAGSINSMDATFVARYCGDATENIGQVGENVTIVVE